MDTEPISNYCPKCKTPLPADAPQGLCPRCLLAAVAMPTEAGQPAGRPTPPPLEEIAMAFPQLEILEFVGQGGMGFVFKARQPKLDRLVALKILPQSLAADPTFAERFNREAKLLARLNHPGIVTVHDFGVAAGILPAVEPGILPGGKGVEVARRLANSDATPRVPHFYYLLMEFVDGVNLRQAMQAGRFTPEQALAIVPKICEALQFAHNEGILHRDIKPENILLDAKGRVKIADFGIAKLVGKVAQASQPAGDLGIPAQVSPTEFANWEQGCSQNPQAGKPALQALTETGKTLGTPNYMAPEQLENAGEVDHRADIYSLGVVFYEMLTGELPTGRFAPPSQKSAADPRVDEVVLRALAKEKSKRPASAEEVRTQVETITMTAGSSGCESAPIKPPTPLANQSRLTSTATFQEPRFSRMAIVGACWAFLGILHFLVPTLGYRMKSEFVPLMMLFVGLSAPLGTTILGWVAVRQIRRSGGRLCGLWLAVFDGLVFPLLVASAACAIGLTLLQQALNQIVSSIFGNGPLFTFGPPIFFTVSLLILAPVVVRRVWLAMNAPVGAEVTKKAPGAAKVAFKWIVIAFGTIALLAAAWLMPGRGRSYPASSMSDAYRAPAIGRIEFKCSHPDRPADGTTGTSYRVKAWGDTQWGPTFVLGSGMFKTRVDASRSIFPVAMVAASLDNVHWETRQVALGTNRSTQSLGFSNGLQMAISWDPFGAPAVNAKRPNPIQQEVMLRASKLSDAKHRVSTADASRLFGPVIERTLLLDKDGSAGWLDLDSGKHHHENFPSASITATTNGGLAATPLVVIQSVGREQWETLTAEQVQQAVGGASFPGFTYDTGPSEGLPKVWLFKTFHGAKGILQLTGYTENPRGVKIRYKLVQNGSLPKAQTDASTNARASAARIETHWPNRDYFLLYAWDVSYNLTTNVASLDSRWQLLLSAITRLRDEGLKEFPEDMQLHRELAWFFQHRLGALKVADDAPVGGVSSFRRSGQDEADPDQIYFRYQWFKLVEQARANGRLNSQLKLDPALMKSVDAQYGPLDWRLPESHAIYWSQRRLSMQPAPTPDDTRTLQRIIFQSLQLGFQHGKVVGQPTPTEMRLERNLDLVPKVNASYEHQLATTDPGLKTSLQNAQRNFLCDAVVALHEAGRKVESGAWFEQLCKISEKRPLLFDDPKSLPGTLNCEEFVKRSKAPSP
jgi:serine/threonine protein kinase